MAAGDFKLNPQTGAYEAQRDGIYQRAGDDPQDRIRVQMRKGHPVSEADAALFAYAEAWPEEAGPKAAEAAATKAAKEPENK
jgi:hypothetical protein